MPRYRRRAYVLRLCICINNCVCDVCSFLEPTETWYAVCNGFERNYSDNIIWRLHGMQLLKQTHTRETLKTEGHCYYDHMMEARYSHNFHSTCMCLGKRRGNAYIDQRLDFDNLSLLVDFVCNNEPELHEGARA
ncbi:hypothetical protein C8Q75DRAFT_782692 [Abortiporus biennis]|nr:hypothetical protein C8Q75DRAFT_782692 [Abortiporus biennis]